MTTATTRKANFAAAHTANTAAWLPTHAIASTVALRWPLLRVTCTCGYWQQVNRLAHFDNLWLAKDHTYTHDTAGAPVAAPVPCCLCGGVTGTLFQGAHALCTARVAHGRPTPNLDTAGVK